MCATKSDGLQRLSRRVSGSAAAGAASPAFGGPRQLALGAQPVLEVRAVLIAALAVVAERLSAMSVSETRGESFTDFGSDEVRRSFAFVLSSVVQREASSSFCDHE